MSKKSPAPPSSLPLGAASPRESELRFAVPPAQQNRLKRLPLLVSASLTRAKSTHLKSTYFDTPEGTLAAAGMGLRVREIGPKRLQTLKIGAGWQAGLAERIELEGWIRGDVPVLDIIHAPDIRAFLEKDGIWARLQPGLVTGFRRTSRDIRFEGRFGSAVIAVDLDIGELRAGTVSAPVSELELELKEGAPTALFELAKALHREVPMRIEYRSKALRAALLTAPPAIPVPVRGRKPVPEQGARINSAAVTILRACQIRVAANEAVVLETRDPGGPHQMRVGLRRMRSALGMFRAFGDPVLTEHVRMEAKWLATSLGEAREWDVYLEDIHAPVEAALHGDLPALKDLRKLAEARRENGYRQAREAVASARFTALELDIGLLIESLCPAPGRGGSPFDYLARSEEFAASRLEKRFRKLCRMGRHARGGSVEAMHDLRLEMKKMRYMAEFFSSLFNPVKARAFTRAAARVQNVLGYLNDHAVAVEQLGVLLAGHGDSGKGHSGGAGARELGQAAGAVIGWHGAGMARATGQIEEAWAGFRDAGRFWPKP